MSNQQLRQAIVAAVTAIGLAVIVSCSNTTGGTAAVGTDFTPTSTSASSTTTTATTTRSSRPTTSSTSSSPTTSSSATATVTARPTDTAGAPMPSATTDLQVGDCYTVGADSVVTAIDCAQLHDGQIFFVDVALTGVDPEETDAAKLFDAALPSCTPEFKTFTGSELSSTTVDYELRIVITSAPGARTVVSCAVVDKTGAQWAGTAQSVSGSYRGVDVGDCFDYPTSTAGAAELPCDQPHDAEMYLLDAALPAAQLDAAAAYPTEAEWLDISSTVCLTGFTDYTGLPFDTSTTLSFSYVYPLVEDWSDVSKRTMSCIVVEEDGTKLVGSKHA